MPRPRLSVAVPRRARGALLVDLVAHVLAHVATLPRWSGMVSYLSESVCPSASSLPTLVRVSCAHAFFRCNSIGTCSRRHPASTMPLNFHTGQQWGSTVVLCVATSRATKDPVLVVRGAGTRQHRNHTPATQDRTAGLSSPVHGRQAQLNRDTSQLQDPRKPWRSRKDG
ncbi:hypothetical protein ERJ75_001036300 [Trypanosoma vivax]|nr:hypothetical protein ERJ75_001036300 [Trypanosoma vivax]